jgi:uncharacterized protein YjbJ (UPF0337 family)
MANKWAQIAGEWERFALEAKKKWGELTDEELIQVEGKRNTLASIIQAQYFVSKKEAHAQIEVWIDALKL